LADGKTITKVVTQSRDSGEQMEDTAVILQALDNGYQYGFDIFDIMDVTGLPSGTVYPALRRLEDAGYVDSRWEKHTIAQAEQRPPRRYYELTKEGKEALAEAVKRYRLLEQTQPQPAPKPKPSRAQ
jgi:DNA-binding PadR family transcriptional regulator